MSRQKGISISERKNFHINLINLALFLIVALTGMILQLKYHLHGLPANWPFMGIAKSGWGLLHKASATLFFAGIVTHCVLKWRFVATITRRIISRERSPFSSLSYDLFVICIPTGVTAFAAWIPFNLKNPVKFLLIETHDKLGLLLIVFTCIHIVARSGRIVSAYRKLCLERRSDLVNPEYGSRKWVVDRSRTEHVLFDSRKCIACWECIAACPNIVFGKINIIVHKHAKIVNPASCTGCRKCVKVCIVGAIIPVTGHHS